MSTVGFTESAGQSVIVGASVDFSLSSALGRASVIRMAVTFMNEAGLKLILEAISNPAQYGWGNLCGLFRD
jgi:predicted ABC-type sugar transport system permease subunit